MNSILFTLLFSFSAMSFAVVQAPDWMPEDENRRACETYEDECVRDNDEDGASDNEDYPEYPLSTDLADSPDAI